jgi:hypothetical protein
LHLAKGDQYLISRVPYLRSKLVLPLDRERFLIQPGSEDFDAWAHMDLNAAFLLSSHW